VSSKLQEALDSYRNYLETERGLSPYTVRNYTMDIIGNYARGAEKGFFQFLRAKQVSSLDEVDKQVMRDYMSWLMSQGVVKSSIARKLSAPAFHSPKKMREPWPGSAPTWMACRC